MSSVLKNGHSRHSYPFNNISINTNYSERFAPLSSPFGKTSSSCFSKVNRENKADKHSKQITDLKLFKQKNGISDEEPPLSCFRLITLQQPKFFISLQDLDQIEFPTLSYTITQLISFSKMIVEATPQRKLIGRSFNLNKLINLIADNYNITAYHNFTHAFSLLLLMFQAYNRCDKLKSLLNQKQWFYVFIAALMHDLKHPGTTNAFQIKARSQFAIDAENHSVLQKLHLNEFWSILKKNSQVNFLQGYASYESASIKNIITRMVLATDVASHHSDLEHLRTIKKNGDLEPKDAQFVVQELFHACDIGNPCLDFTNYIGWGALVSYQFDQVARKEKQLGLEVTGFLKYQNLRKFYGGQIGFTKGLVFPLWRELGTILPGITVMNYNIASNLEELQRRMTEQSQI